MQPPHSDHFTLSALALNAAKSSNPAPLKQRGFKLSCSFRSCADNVVRMREFLAWVASRVFTSEVIHESTDQVLCCQVASRRSPLSMTISTCAVELIMNLLTGGFEVLKGVYESSKRSLHSIGGWLEPR